MRAQAAFGSAVSAGAMVRPTTHGRRTGSKATPKRHYTADEIDHLAGVGGVDIVLTHDAPAGVRFERHRRGASHVSEAAGLNALLAHVRPRVCWVIITRESTRKFRVFAAPD
jgi:hypothetical protein